MAPAAKKQRLMDGSALPAEHVEDEKAGKAEPSPKADEPAKVGNESKDSAPHQSSRSLFVRSLPANTTSESLADLFSDSYPVKHAVAVNDPATNQCRGFGFVTFADAEDAQQAKIEFNGRVVDGRKIRVEIADPRDRDAKKGTVSEAKAKREREKAESKQPPKLIIRNLPWTIKTSEQLSNLFLSYGKVKQAYIPKRSGGLLPGFGFVILRGRKNAEKAIEGVNGKEIDGRVVAVDWAVLKEVYQQTGEAEQTVDNGEQIDAAAADDEVSDNDESEDANVEEPEPWENGEGEDEEQDEDDWDNEDASDEESENEQKSRSEDISSTLFVRNLPFTCTDEDLEDHFSVFGAIRYARIVMDHTTERPKGTGFVCFYSADDAGSCLRGAPSRSTQIGQNDTKPAKPTSTTTSVLQNPDSDPSGKYTLDGRVVFVSRAVDKTQARRLTEEGLANRHRRDRDKRRLYLLSEGTISTKSKLWESLPPSERTLREASQKQRKALIESNPSLHLSFTRLSIRNMPRSIDSKALKALAREAVVGFAKDVKDGKRQKLSREELERGAEEMASADQARKSAGKGVVKQAKVVFEGEGGSKVSESSGAGRSRGYGFIEFHTHRNALMGLRWLNGHSIGYSVQDPKAQHDREAIQDRKKRLIAEFAIENAQVVQRRREREQKARDRSKLVQDGKSADDSASGPSKGGSRRQKENAQMSRKRKRGDTKPTARQMRQKKEPAITKEAQPGRQEQVDDKIAQRNRIIGRKRAMRRTKRGQQQ